MFKNLYTNSILLYICISQNKKYNKMEILKTVAITMVAVIIALYVKNAIDSATN